MTTTTEETALDLEALRQGYPARYLAARPRRPKNYRPDLDRAAGRRRMRLWALLTREPSLPVRAIARRMRIGTTTAQTDLAALEAAGYIQPGPYGSAGTRVVLIPCYTVRRA